MQDILESNPKTKTKSKTKSKSNLNLEKEKINKIKIQESNENFYSSNHLRQMDRNELKSKTNYEETNFGITTEMIHKEITIEWLIWSLEEIENENLNEQNNVRIYRKIGKIEEIFDSNVNNLKDYSFSQFYSLKLVYYIITLCVYILKLKKICFVLFLLFFFVYG